MLGTEKFPCGQGDMTKSALSKASLLGGSHLKHPNSWRRTILDSGRGEAHYFHFGDNVTVLGSVSNVLTRVQQLEQWLCGLSQ